MDGYAVIPEGRLLLLLSGPDLKEESLRAAGKLAGEGINWPLFLYLAIQHRVESLLGALADRGLVGFLPRNVRRTCHAVFMLNRLRHEEIRRQMVPVLADLLATGASFALVKGLFAEDLWGTPGTRRFNDIDLLVTEEELPHIHEALSRLGFIQGSYDEARREVVPASRKEIIFFRRYSHQVVQYARRVSHRELPVLNIDVNLELFWRGRNSYTLPVQEVLLDRQWMEVENVPAPILTPANNVIQLAAHLYKEANVLFLIERGKDTQLYKFRDLALLVRGHSVPWAELIARVRQFGLQKPLYYALFYTDLLYEGIPSDVLSAIRPDSLDYLDEFGVENSQPGRWPVDFMTRLFHPARYELIRPLLAEGFEEYHRHASLRQDM